jgi:hypothetical protein
VLESKRKKTEDEAGEIKRSRLFRLVSNKPTTTVAKEPKSETKDVKVLLLSSLKDCNGVKNAVVVDSSTDPTNYEKLIKAESVTDMFCRVQLHNDDEKESGYVYDVYRMDLGVFTLDSEAVQTAVEIVLPQQEFLTDEEGSDSEGNLEDEDSNAEDHYANDYPEEDSDWGTTEDSDWDEQQSNLDLYAQLHACYGSDESIPDHSYRDYMPGGVYYDFTDSES